MTKSLFQEYGFEKIEEILTNKTDFFQAPASSKYHLNVTGGLVAHSINVFTQLKVLNDRLKLSMTDRDCFVIGMFHDLCKVGLYKENILKSGKVSESIPYVVQDDFPLGHGEKSLYILCALLDESKSDYIIKPEVALAIRWHEGKYNDEYNRFVNHLEKHKGYKIIVATQMADEISSKILED